VNPCPGSYDPGRGSLVYPQIWEDWSGQVVPVLSCVLPPGLFVVACRNYPLPKGQKVKIVIWGLAGALAIGLLLVAGIAYYQINITNPRMVGEIRNNPTGEAAGRAMLLTFPDGKTIPVNYLREGNKVFVGADGPWWRDFQQGGASVSLLVRGEMLKGHATSVLDDPSYTTDVFSRLRPAVPKWLPDWLNATLVVIEIDSSAEQ